VDVIVGVKVGVKVGVSVDNDWIDSGPSPLELCMGVPLLNPVQAEENSVKRVIRLISKYFLFISSSFKIERLSPIPRNMDAVVSFFQFFR
jgi:hypothetical protein